MQVDLTIPFWGLIILSLGGIGFTIRFYINVSDMKKEIKNLHDSDLDNKRKLEECYTRLDKIKESYQLDLEIHKRETTASFSKINQKLDQNNETLVEVKTLVGVLVKDRK